MMLFFLVALSSFLRLLTLSNAQSSCPGPSPSGGIRPSVASGYRLQVVATGLSEPRGILLDGAGNLLVVEQGRGAISSHSLTEDNGCVSVQDSSDVTESTSVDSVRSMGISRSLLILTLAESWY